MLTFSVEIVNSSWLNVVTIPCGTTLLKGRRNDHYRTLSEATAAVNDQGGCYSWSSSIDDLANVAGIARSERRLTVIVRPLRTPILKTMVDAGSANTN